MTERDSKKLDYETLNPGIRETVRWLRETLGFYTVDSGDGVTQEFECDRGYPYVTIIVDTSAWDVREVANVLAGLVYNTHGHKVTPQGQAGPSVQVSYDPSNRMTVLELMDFDDSMLKPRE